jgi:hypothetical protein
MASTTFTASHLPAERRMSGTVGIFKRCVDALMASRARAAAIELRRHDFRIRESSLVHGETCRVPLSEADLLPFTNR